MVSLSNYNLRLIQPLTVLVPIVLWVALWLSIGGGNSRDILNPPTLRDFGDGLRSIFPFVAGGVALVLIAVKLPGSRPWKMLFVGPLGLAAVYGAVGILAVLVSPDATTAIFWTAAYISVPLVLWSVTWGDDPLKQLLRLINLTWAVIVLAAGILFAIALVYMDLGEVIRNPAGFLRCEDAGHWFTQTSGILRSTGVGRYAALASIVAFAGLWQGKFRWLWGLVLLGALMLLTTTGARTSMLALIPAIGLVTLIYGGKWAVVAGLLALVILIPLHYLTEVDRVFLDECFLHKGLTHSAQGETAQGLHTQPTVQTEVTEVKESLQTSDNVRKQPDLTSIPKNPSNAHTPSTPPTVRARSGAAQAQATPPTVGARSDAAQVQTPPPTIAERADRAQTKATPTMLPKEFSAPQSEAKLPTIPRTPNIHPSKGPPTLVAVDPPVTRAEAVPIPMREEPNDAQALVFDSQVTTGDESKEFPISETKTANQLSGPRGPSDNSLTESKLLNLSGRTGVWEAGVELVKDSPILGHGFHADRIILEAHMHNAILHALVQTGFIGTIPFLAAVSLTWFLVVKALRNLQRLPGVHKHIIIQMAALLAFLSVRAIAESTGAFFGVDWLLLALVFSYFQIVGYTIHRLEQSP